VQATLYAISVSHPARAAGLMLRHKGIDFKVVNVPPGSQQVAIRGLGFRGGTVPALKIDGRRVQGTLEISRVLEELLPEPPLFPADPERRVAVEDAERWGEHTYQPVPRRIFRWAVTSDRRLRAWLARQSGIPAPDLAAAALWPATQFYVRLEGGGEAAARADVAALPSHLDRVDELIAAGTLDGETLNAADYQIGTTTRVLLNIPQLRPLVEGRPAQAHALRVIADFGDEGPVRLPPEWLPVAGAGAAS
jgi:glutathione S-transferase